MTPEGKVKREITKILDRWALVVPMHVWMPVPNGYGKSGLDYHCVVAGHTLIIEAKAPGGEPTPRQRDALKLHLEAGATCFVVSEKAGLDALDRWFRRQYVPDNGAFTCEVCGMIVLKSSHGGPRCLSRACREWQ